MTDIGDILDLDLSSCSGDGLKYACPCIHYLTFCKFFLFKLSHGLFSIFKENLKMKARQWKHTQKQKMNGEDPTLQKL